MSPHFLDMTMNDNHVVIEPGSGKGIFSMIASALIPQHRPRVVLAIEENLERYQFLCKWIQNIRKEKSAEKPGMLSSYPKRLPTVRLGDFTSSDIPYYNHLIANRRALVYLNNYNGVIQGSSQIALEDKLRTLKTGSIIIALGAFFVGENSENQFWQEERYHTFLRRKHVPMWTQRSRNHNEKKKITIYKYTKKDTVCAKQCSPRLAPSKFVKFPYLNQEYSDYDSTTKNRGKRG